MKQADHEIVNNKKQEEEIVMMKKQDVQIEKICNSRINKIIKVLKN